MWGPKCEKVRKPWVLWFLCCSVFEWRTTNGVELSVAFPSIMFSAVKSWNFVGLRLSFCPQMTICG